MSAASHVFIVGLPRTGSTLTRRMLNRSGDVGMSEESRFLREPIRFGLVQRPGFADRFRAIGDLRTDAGLARIVDHIYSMQGKGYWPRLASIVDRSDFRSALLGTDRSDAALLDVAMMLYANGRPVRGEKTPHHVYHVRTLLTWYPEARVIQTLRDPRAVYVSLRRKERPEKLSAAGRAARRAEIAFNMYAVANVAHRWRTMAHLHRAYSVEFPLRYALMRFEDLVSAPEEAMQRLTDFLSIDYDDRMLDQIVHNSSYGGRMDSGIDASTVDRWRDHLGAAEHSLFRRLLGSEMREFGYDP